jgi:predicted amidohydrolase
MIVGAAQFKVRDIECIQNFKSHIEELVAEGSSQGVNLLVFPEYLSVELISILTGSGYDGEEALRSVGVSFKKDYLNIFTELSRKYGMAISTGSLFCMEEPGSNFYNSNFLVLPNGVITEQRKTHTTYELVYNKDIISKGNELIVSGVGNALVGTLICYDAGFPENGRILMRKGANVILQPGCVFDKFGANRLKIFASARATENQLFVVNSQLAGDLAFLEDHHYHFEAVSSIHAPTFPEFGHDDGILATANANEECVISAKLDLELLTKVRKYGIPQYLKDRREDFYETNRPRNLSTCARSITKCNTL